MPTRRPPVLLALTGLLCGLLAGPVYSQDGLGGEEDFVTEELFLFDDVPGVFAASRFEQPITEAPASITIITSDQIREYGYQSLVEVLDAQHGFFTTYDRNYNYVGVRGFAPPGDYNSRLLFLIDGVRINDEVYDSVLIGRGFPVDIAMIDRIEIVRGPTSSLYGASGVFGVINVITRRGSDLRGAESQAAYGSFDSYELGASYGDVTEGGTEFLVSATLYASDGDDRLYYREFDDPSTNNGIARDNDAERAKNLFLQLSHGGFTMQAAYYDREKEIPTGSFGTFFNAPSDTHDSVAYVHLFHETRLDSGWFCTTQLGYQETYYQGDYFYDYGPPDGIVINDDTARGRSLMADVQAQRRFESHDVTIGLSYRANLEMSQKNEDLAVYVDDERDSNLYGAFVQDHWTLDPTWSLSLGLRLDQYETFGSTVNPRIAAIFQPTDRSTLKAIVGSAFRAPNAFELYYNDGNSTTKANPDLDPETIETYELVWEQAATDHFRWTVTGFYNELDDLIVLITDPNDGLLVFENRDSVSAHGIEAEVEGRWESGLRGRVSYSYVRTHDSTTKSRMTNSPEHMLKAGASVPLPGGLRAGLELRAMSERKTLLGGTADSFFTVDLNLLEKDLVDGVEVSAKVRNLFDVEIEHPGGQEHTQNTIEIDGRTFWVEVRASF